MFKILGTLLLPLFLILWTGCGTTGETKKKENSAPVTVQNQKAPSQNPNNNAQNSSGDTNNDTNSSTDTPKSIYSCTSDLNSENLFTDSFAQNNHDDIKWPESLQYNTLSVKDIEQTFNAARAEDPTVTVPMVLPPQNIWSNYSTAEKILYLVNKERCDRGLRPFEGIDPAISNVSASYATYLKNNPDKYATSPHEADGRTPWERMAQDAGVNVNQNADFFQYGENIASLAIGSSVNYPVVYESEARSVYGWMYHDKVQGFGHRHFLMATGLVENSGAQNAEGLIGVGITESKYKEGNFFWTEKIIVMDGFDPKSNWDNNLASAQQVNLYR